MRDLLPVAAPVLEPVMVRLRCAACEVAWTGAAESPCWVCGEPGNPLNTALVVRARGGVASFDLDLFG